MRRALMMSAAMVAPAAVAVAVLLAAAPASATVLTYKSWYSTANGPDPASTPQTYVQTDWNGVSQKILVPQFDTSLGTLTAATLLLYADANSNGSVQNTGTATANVTSYASSLRVRILTPSSSQTGPGIDSSATVTTPYLAEALPALISITGKTLQAGASQAFTVAGASNASSAYDLFADKGVLPFFQGTGQATLPVYTSTRTTSNYKGGNLVLTQNTQARAEAVVTYTYTAAAPPPPGRVPVPEPRSAALLGASLLSLGFLGRRR